MSTRRGYSTVGGVENLWFKSLSFRCLYQDWLYLVNISAMTPVSIGIFVVAQAAVWILDSGASRLAFFTRAGCTWLLHFLWPRSRLGLLLWPRWRWESFAQEPVIWQSVSYCLYLVDLSQWPRCRLGFLLWPRWHWESVAQGVYLFLFSKTGCACLIYSSGPGFDRDHCCGLGGVKNQWVWNFSLGYFFQSWL